MIDSPGQSGASSATGGTARIKLRIM